MKKLFIAALLFVGVASFAQDTDSNTTQDHKDHKERMTPEQRNEKQLKKLTTELSLDANQQAQVKQLLADRSAKAEKFREARQAKKDSNVKPTTAEREAFKKEMMAEKDANDAKMKAILNADQYTKWKAIQAENKEKAREKKRSHNKFVSQIASLFHSNSLMISYLILDTSFLFNSIQFYSTTLSLES